MTLNWPVTTFTAGTTTQVTVTHSGATFTYIGTDYSWLRFSLDGQVWQSWLRLDESPVTVHVRVASSAQNGSYSDGIGYSLVNGDEQENGDIAITVTGGTEPKYESLSFSFAPRISTIQYQATLANTPVTVGSTLRGNILDYNYSFEVERVAEQGARRVIGGASYAEWLVNSLIEYSVRYELNLSGWSRPTITDHLNAIASQIGKTIIYRGVTFEPQTEINYAYRTNPLSLNFYERITGSFGELLNKLIGWSNDVPGMAINMHVDGNTIYLIQQGYETNTRTPEAWAVLPTITRTKRHTQWANTQYQTVTTPKQIASSDSMKSNTPYSGTIIWGQTSLTYSGGYLMQEVRGNATTTYTYTDLTEGKALSRKETVDTDADTYSVTTYTYQSTGTESYLFEEVTQVYDGQDNTGVLINSSLTRHVPIGGGWYGTTVYDTTYGEEEISSNLSQGAPGQKASQYMIDATNDALKPSSSTPSDRQLIVPLTGVAKVRQTYPIADLSTLQAVGQALDNYEGKTEETLQGEIAGGSHIYTYEDKIVYKGNEYHIVSNNITRSYATVRQNITAVRWIL